MSLRRSSSSVRAHLAASAVAGVLLAGGAPRSAAAPPPQHQIKMATVAPEGTTWMKVMRDIDAEVRRETGNAVGFKIYPGGVQGDEQVVLRKIRSGQLQGGGLTGLGLGKIAEEVRVLELPFLFDSYEEVDRAHAKVDAELEARLYEGGYTLLGWADVGFVYLFAKRPIATQADLKSAKMWLWEGDPLAESFFAAAGVVPVPQAITDVMTSLQTGLVNAVYTTPLGCLALQWFTRVSTFTDVPVTFATGAVVVSNAAFEAIPAVHRDTVRRIARAKFRDLVLRTRQEDAEALQQIETSGVRRIAVSAAERDRFEAVGRGVWKELVGKLYPQSLLDAVLSAAEAPAGGAAR
jgi:TRAP-type C4-dicarboxylate transport system substrate-binding protein